MKYTELDDLIHYSFLSSLKYSPGAGLLAFKLHKMDLGSNSYRHYLYSLDPSDLSLRRLASLGANHNFTWLDPGRILVSQREKGQTQFYQLDLATRERLDDFQIPLTVRSFDIIDENRLILACNYQARPQTSGSCLILDELPFWENAGGYRIQVRTRLYIYNRAQKSLEPISRSRDQVLAYRLNRSRKRLVFIARNFEGLMPLTNQVHSYDLDSKKLLDLGLEGYKYSYADFIGDEIVAMATDMKAFGLNENPSFYRLRGPGSQELIRGDLDLSLASNLVSDTSYGSGYSCKTSGDYLYFISTEGTSSRLRRLDLGGRLETLTGNRGSIDCFDVCQDQLSFIGLRDMRLQEVYRLRGQEEVKLTGFNDFLQDKLVLQPDQLSLDLGWEQVDGFVLKPAGYKPEKSYPAILSIHGGPKTAFGRIFHHEIQYLASQGYFVIYCNPRGSDGKGNSFADLRGAYGSIDYEDLMNFLDLALRTYPSIDRQALGLMGGSYGGFMTNWIIGHNQGFKAAVSQRSISNWFSFFGTSDIGYYFTADQQAGDPWSQTGRLWEKSPLAYAENIRTATLLIHSSQDYRCPISESYQLFTALKYLGQETRLCVFKGENHELSRSGLPRNRIRRLEEISSWFKQHLS